MTEEKVKAIVLRSIPFKDRQSILTLFSEELGMISMIIKGMSKDKPQLQTIANPLTEAEFVFMQGRSDLLKCRDASLLEPHFFLRQKYAFLETATQLCHILISTQFHGKPAPHLYALFSSFLKQIPSFEQNMTTLLSSFYLKFLKHEGLASLQINCVDCQNERASHLDSAGCFCQRHAPRSAIAFSYREWDLLERLMESTSFNALREIKLSAELYEKVRSYFRLKSKEVH